MYKKSWSYLQSGDTVDVIAPASNSPLHKLQSGVKWLESIGLKANVPEEIIQKDLFFSAPLPLQIQHLKSALYSDSSAIWCLRGGYGSMRLIPHLLKLTPPKRPKLFIGFSDITALHLFFTQHWNWPVIHGRNLSQMDPTLAKTSDRIFLQNIIFGKKDHKTFKSLIPMNQAALKIKTLKAKITGGNLRILQSSLGTCWELSARGKILFIEDVGERGYSIDRMLEQLIQSKIIHAGLKAIIFGDFTEGLEKDGKDLTRSALERFSHSVPYPVLKGLPSGHGMINYPIPFNTNCELKLGPKSELTCLYGGAI